MNRRRFRRKEVPNTTVELFDGSNTVAGVVKNVSNIGIEIFLCSETIYQRDAKLDLRLFYDGHTCRIGAIPRWQQNDGDGNKVGLRICEAPRKWSQFRRNISVAGANPQPLPIIARSIYQL